MHGLLSWLAVVGLVYITRVILSTSQAADIYKVRILLLTSAVLRLECSIDCISGSVGHQQNILRSFSHCQRFF